MTSFADAAPPTRGPWLYLAWLVVRQRRRVALGAVLGTLWMVGLVLPPFLLSQAVDALTGAEPTTVLAWSAALVATGTVLAVLGIWRHRTMTQVRMDAAFRTISASRLSRCGWVMRSGVAAGLVRSWRSASAMCGRSVAVSP